MQRRNNGGDFLLSGATNLRDFNLGKNLGVIKQFDRLNIKLDNNQIIHEIIMQPKIFLVNQYFNR